jgi:hypothetical protein
MRVPTSFVAAVVCAGAVVIAAACKSSTSGNGCGSGSPPSLVGSYDLQSYTIGTVTISAPAATGTLRFHTNTYGADLVLPGPQVISDSGTYTITGASCISENSLTGQPQFTGTFTLVGTTFSVTGSAGGQTVAVWTKTS